MYYSNDESFSSPLSSPPPSSPSPPLPNCKLDPNVQHLVTEFIKNKDTKHSTVSRPQGQSSASSRKRRSSDSILHSAEVRALLGITGAPIKEEEVTPPKLSVSSEVKTKAKTKGGSRSKSNPSTPKKGHRRNLSNPTSLGNVVPEFDKIQLPQPAGLGTIQEETQEAAYEANFQATKQMLKEQRARQLKDLEEMAAFYQSRAHNPDTTQQEMLHLQEQMDHQQRVLKEQEFQLQQLEQWKEHINVQKEQKQRQLEELQRQLHERMMRKYQRDSSSPFGQLTEGNYYPQPMTGHPYEYGYTNPRNDPSLETMLTSPALDNVNVTNEDYNNMMVIISSMNNTCLAEGNAGENTSDVNMDAQPMEEVTESQQEERPKRRPISSVRSLERFLESDLEQLATYQQQHQGEMVDVDYWMNSVLV